MQPLFLKIFYQGKLLRVCPFTDDQISIGSGEGLSLKLRGIAPWHIIIEKKWDRYTIFDLGSETGTFIGGQRVAGEQTLESGSTFQIGPYHIQFFVGPPPATSPSPSGPAPVSPSREAVLPEGSSFPSQRGVAPPQREAIPPIDETVSPVRETVPPVKEAIPPQRGVTPLIDETVSPARETVPPLKEAIPPQRGVTPPIDETVPSAKETAHLKEEAISIQKGVTPPIDETVPSAKETSHLKEEAISIQRGVTPPIDETVPSAKETSHLKEEAISIQRGVTSPIEEAVPSADSPQPPSFSQGIPKPPSIGVESSHAFKEDASLGQKESRSAPKAFEKLEGKGFWRTFAPPDKVQSLDEYLEPSVGNLIEVLISWQDRILNSFHFSQKGHIHLGSAKDCEVPLSNLIGLKKYKLLEIGSGAKVFLDHGVKGALIQKKGEENRIIHPLPGNQSLLLRPYEIVRIDFKNLLRVYIRIKSKPASIIPASLFNLTFSESAVLFFSFLTTSLLLFYAGLYAPAFLQKEADFLEKNIVTAVVKFEKKPTPPEPRVVEMKLSDKTQAEKKKSVVKQRVKKKKPQIKKPRPVVVRKSKKPKVVPKKIGAIKKPGKKPGKITTVAKGRKAPVKKKVAVGSARPGGSLKTGKSGATAKTVAPDPTKTGLLGVFGGGGKLAKLDTGATGSTGGGLLGLAETSTGFAGTKEGYEGEGVGTKTKELATGGQGTSLVGIKGIKTKGRGGNLLGKGRGTGGSLGSRGRVNINIGADDIEIEGEIDKAGILRVIRRNRVKFDKCYQFSLQQQASLSGAIKMEWQILSSGSVRKARAIQDSVGSDSLSNCMRRVLSRLRFPAPPGGQIPKVSFRFLFSI